MVWRYNHLFYADDLVLLSPSALGMQKLLSECEKYASEYGMKFNENKSVVLNFNTLRPRQNGRRFADDTFKRIFLNENVKISIKISLKFVPKGPINKPLSEPMKVSLLTHICVTRPQWVKGYKFKAKPSATLYLNGSIMKTETSFKYLGHIIDNNLNDNKDIERHWQSSTENQICC